MFAPRILLLLPVLAFAAPDPVQMQRGERLYAEKCALCHQPNGAGVPPVHPPLATFDAHSSPAGMIWCGDDWPAPLRRTFLIGRFGNLLGAPAAPGDVGFDVLSAKPERVGDGWTARITTVLAPLGRPIDIVRTDAGRALILEYTRPTNFRERLGWLPGRIIELSATAL